MKKADQKTIESERKWLITLCIQLSIALKLITRLLIDEKHLLNLYHQYCKEYHLLFCSNVKNKLTTNTENFGSTIHNHLSVKKVTYNEILFENNYNSYIKSVAPLALDKVALQCSNAHWNQASVSEWPDTSFAIESDCSNTHYTTSVVSNIASTVITSNKDVVGCDYPTVVVHASESVDTYVG